jgi:hypothetical protein
VEVFVDGGIQPTLGHLKTAVGNVFGLPQDRVRLAKYISGQKEWVELVAHVKNESKRGRKRKGGQRGTNKKSESIVQGLYNLREGDLIVVVDTDDVKDLPFSWDRPEDLCARAKRTEDRSKKRGEKKKRKDHPEIALKLGGDLNFSDDSSGEDEEKQSTK